MHCMRRPTSAVDGISVGQTPRWRWRLRQALADGGYRDHRIACARDAKLGGNQDLLVYVRTFSRPRMKAFQHADVSIMRLAAWHTVHRPSWLHARDDLQLWAPARRGVRGQHATICRIHDNIIR